MQLTDKDLDLLRQGVDQKVAPTIKLETINPPAPGPSADEARQAEATTNFSGRDLEILSPAQLPKTPFILRGLQFDCIESTADFIAVISQQIPVNEYNFPKFIIRPDLIDPDFLRTASAEEQQHHLDASTIKLTYHEGYPSLPNGAPIWSELPFESVDAFDLFNQYRDLPGARQLALLKSNSNTTTVDLKEAFHCNYWRVRCLAYDTFAVLHLTRLREKRILQCEDVHYLEAERLLTALKAQFANIDWESCRDPKTYVDLWEKLMKGQRLALGLSSQGKESNPQLPSLELIMRRMLSNSPQATETQKPDAQDNIRDLLKDGKFTTLAQEMILRYGAKDKPDI